MKSTCFTVFTSLSAGVLLLFAVLAWFRYSRNREKKKLLSTVQFFTLGVFAATVLFFQPVYYCYYFQSFDIGKGAELFGYVKPFFLSVHNSLRLFILDGEFDIIVEALGDRSDSMQFWCSGYALALYVIAPVLTFGNVLSLFANFWDGWRFFINRKKTLYVFSALNARSMALAKDINERSEKKQKKLRDRVKSFFKRSEQKQKKIKKSLIVFCGVHERDEEDNAQMLMQARAMHAVCLRNDITNRSVFFKRCDIELFIMGENEAENVSKGAQITKDLNDIAQKHTLRHKIRVFVFNQSEGAGHVIDSIRYQYLLPEPSEDTEKQDADGAEKPSEDLKSGTVGKDLFKLRRVDEKQQLVWNTLPKMNVFDLKKDACLYVLIAGLGSYGMEFFKTILWFAQFEGHKLYITIADKRTREQIESMINRQCPDVLKTQKSEIPGEAHYDIEIIPEVDVSQSDLADILLKEDTGCNDDVMLLQKRLRRTNLAIVALGDDNQNIETAVHLRTVFDRAHGFTADKKTKEWHERVQIYSIVYDELISHNLHTDDTEADSDFLKNFKKIPYHIHFIGSMTEQFTYQNVHDAVLEEDAYSKHHVSWVHIDRTMYYHWKDTNPALFNRHFRTWESLEEGQPYAGKIIDKDTYENWYQNDRATYEAYFKKEPQLSNHQMVEQYQYARFEYYRLSSISKELYWREIHDCKEINDTVTCLRKDKDGNTHPSCLCENCMRRKRSEHMRWNAYIRSYGFSHAPKRNDRAMLHNNLVAWDALSELEKCKD